MENKAFEVTHTDAEWRSLIDGRHQYPSADLVGQVLIFNVLGNHFRMLSCVIGGQQFLGRLSSGL